MVVKTAGARLRSLADVAMVQAADFGKPHDPARPGELDGPEVWRILGEREVCARLCFARTSSDSLVTIRHPRCGREADPGTGRPASSELSPCTVLADSRWVTESEQATRGSVTPFGIGNHLPNNKLLTEQHSRG
jgi:hypothetical protein